MAHITIDLNRTFLGSAQRATITQGEGEPLSPREEAVRYTARVAQANCRCHHGHIGCADRDGGRCLREVYHNAGLRS